MYENLGGEKGAVKDWNYCMRSPDNVPNGQFTCVGPELHFETFSHFVKLFQAFTGKRSHDDGMLFVGIGNTAHGNVAISDGLHLGRRNSNTERVSVSVSGA